MSIFFKSMTGGGAKGKDKSDNNENAPKPERNIVIGTI